MGAWPVGQPRTLDYPELAVDAILAGAARQYGDRIALWDGTESLSFVELHDAARRFARGLRERGVGPGTVLALALPNCLWFPVAYYGVLLAGAAAVPLNPTQPASALRHQLHAAGATAAVAHATCRRALDDVTGLSLLVEAPATFAGPSPIAGPQSGAGPHRGAVPWAELLAAAPIEPTAIDPDSTAHLIFTGGTTGRSKAVRATHRNVVANTLQTACWRYAAEPAVDPYGGLGLRPQPAAATDWTMRVGGESVASVSPVFHVMGLISQVHNLITGTTGLFLGRFDPERLLAAVEEHRIGVLTGAPPMHRALLAAESLPRRDVSSVRIVSSGGAPLDPATLGRLGDAFERAIVVQGYGLTEVTMTISQMPLDRRGPIASVGLPLYDTALQTRDPADPDRVLADGEIGELWVRGPQVTAGYPDDDELTARQFVDGWLRTGDLAQVDDEGYLHIVGRAKDMLIYKGYNVYPQQLEEVLATHPAVLQSSVVGLPDPDAGEIPLACVVLRPDHVATADELIGYVAQHVAPYQRVRQIRFVDTIPVSPAGKVLKADLLSAL